MPSTRAIAMLRVDPQTVALSVSAMSGTSATALHVNQVCDVVDLSNLF